MDYRRLAFRTYEHICAYCGFGIEDVLEVGHIDGNHQNSDISNLVILCPTCHRMLDLDIISNFLIKVVRGRSKKANWKKLIKDAGKKAAIARKQGALKKRHREAGIKAAETRVQKVKRKAMANPENG